MATTTELQLSLMADDISKLANKFNVLTQSLSSTIAKNNDEVVALCEKAVHDNLQLVEVLDSLIRYIFADSGTTEAEAASLIHHLNSFLNRNQNGGT